VIAVTARARQRSYYRGYQDDATLTSNQDGRATMGLLMSDTMLIDPMADDATWLAERLREWSYGPWCAPDADDLEGSANPE
jgi:hypothetical protein